MGRDLITISGTGCALADFLYTDVRFDSPAFLKYRSVRAGDGGVYPGKLVFTEGLEQFAKKPYPEILQEITGNVQPDSFNIGGPGLVSLIHASQMLEEDNVEINFYGGLGKDETARQITEMLKKTPLNISNYKVTGNKPTPFTDVFSDRTYNHNHGERSFVNNIGAAWDYTPEFLDDDFFNSDIVCFGGTALVPPVHDQLTSLLRRAKQNNCITIVNTVYDFLNEKKSPGKKWPLVSSYRNFKYIDLLIMDGEEALRISGENSIGVATLYFMNSGIPAFVITNGAEDVVAYSSGVFFHNVDVHRLPVSKKVGEDLRTSYHLKGDTTGCGDNFAGGMIASIAKQLNTREIGELDLIEAVSWGVVSGGVACFYKGGTFFEQEKGEKLKLLQSYYQDYLNQIGINEPSR